VKVTREEELYLANSQILQQNVQLRKRIEELEAKLVVSEDQVNKLDGLSGAQDKAIEAQQKRIEELEADLKYFKALDVEKMEDELIALRFEVEPLRELAKMVIESYAEISDHHLRLECVAFRAKAREWKELHAKAE
jgi:uncharacterized coiled-coil protein SlyX